MAIVILAATVSLVPEIPTVGLVLLVSVDWFVGIARAFGNIVGNCAAAIVVATWEKDIDLQHVRKTLAHASTSENTRQTNTHTLKNISNDDIGGE